jgi:hypothetical protein
MALVQTLPAANLDFTATPILDNKHTVLDGFPSSLPTQMAWNASTLTERDYTYHLSNADVLKIEAALGSFKSKHLAFHFNQSLAPPHLTKLHFCQVMNWTVT